MGEAAVGWIAAASLASGLREGVAGRRRASSTRNRTEEQQKLARLNATRQEELEKVKNRAQTLRSMKQAGGGLTGSGLYEGFGGQTLIGG